MIATTQKQRALELITLVESGEDIMKPLGARLAEHKRWQVELHNLTIAEAEKQGQIILTTANVCIHFDMSACLRLPKPDNCFWLLREMTEDVPNSAVIMEEKTEMTRVIMSSDDSIALAMLRAWWSFQL